MDRSTAERAGTGMTKRTKGWRFIDLSSLGYFQSLRKPENVSFQTVSRLPPVFNLLSDDQQSQKRNDVEEQEKDLEQPEEGVNDHVEGLP